MPCRDDYPPNFTSAADNAEHQLLTRLACEYCKELEAKRLLVPTYAAEWWADHKRQDEARAESERRHRVLENSRKKALKKLSPAEREVLGL